MVMEDLLVSMDSLDHEVVITDIEEDLVQEMDSDHVDQVALMREAQGWDVAVAEADMAAVAAVVPRLHLALALIVSHQKAI